MSKNRFSWTEKCRGSMYFLFWKLFFAIKLRRKCQNRLRTAVAAVLRMVFFKPLFLLSEMDLKKSTPKSPHVYDIKSGARLENYWNSLAIFNKMTSEGPFWASRCGFIVLSKSTAKLDSKSEFCVCSAILCTRVRTRSAILKIEFKNRLWCEHVCKVRVRLMRFTAVL